MIRASLAEHFVSQFSNSGPARRESLLAGRSGPIESALLPIHHNQTRDEESGCFETVQHRIDSAGAQTMPVAGKFVDERSAMDVTFASVMHKVHLYGAADEISNEFHIYYR